MQLILYLRLRFGVGLCKFVSPVEHALAETFLRIGVRDCSFFGGAIRTVAILVLPLHL